MVFLFSTDESSFSLFKIATWAVYLHLRNYPSSLHLEDGRFFSSSHEKPTLDLSAKHQKAAAVASVFPSLHQGQVPDLLGL